MEWVKGEETLRWNWRDSVIKKHEKWLRAKCVLEAYVCCPMAKGIRWHYHYFSQKIQVLLAFSYFRICTSLFPFVLLNAEDSLQILCTFPQKQFFQPLPTPTPLNWTLLSFVILQDTLLTKIWKECVIYTYFPLSLTWEVKFVIVLEWQLWLRLLAFYPSIFLSSMLFRWTYYHVEQMTLYFLGASFSCCQLWSYD